MRARTLDVILADDSRTDAPHQHVVHREHVLEHEARRAVLHRDIDGVVPPAQRNGARKGTLTATGSGQGSILGSFLLRGASAPRDLGERSRQTKRAGVL
eukprot:1184046-Prymnesium_polylepis.1